MLVLFEKYQSPFSSHESTAPTNLNEGRLKTVCRWYVLHSIHFKSGLKQLEVFENVIGLFKAAVHNFSCVHHLQNVYNK